MSGGRASTPAQENVEIVRSILAEWEEGTFFGAMATLFDPGVAFETFMPDASENVVAEGMDEVAAFLREWFAQWHDYRIVGDEFQDVARDTVFVSGRQIASGRHSGVEVESPLYSVWTLRRGMVVRLFLHYDRDEALEAVRDTE